MASLPSNATGVSLRRDSSPGSPPAKAWTAGSTPATASSLQLAEPADDARHRGLVLRSLLGAQLQPRLLGQLADVHVSGRHVSGEWPWAWRRGAGGALGSGAEPSAGPLCREAEEGRLVGPQGSTQGLPQGLSLRWARGGPSGGAEQARPGHTQGPGAAGTHGHVKGTSALVLGAQRGGPCGNAGTTSLA